MNILVCGKDSHFCEQLISRLGREKNEIFYISGEPNSQPIKGKVFQQYQFPFGSKSIGRIIAGAAPDIMIVLGACDNANRWNGMPGEETEYLNGLVSLFIAANEAGVSRVIYLSSTDVYEMNGETEITRETVPQTVSARCRALVEAEDLCSQFSNETTKIVKLRLPTVYGDANDPAGWNTPVRLTREFLKENTVTCYEGRQHSAMHYMDAAQAVISLMQIPAEELQPLYQLKGTVFDEQELGRYLLDSGWNRQASINLLREEQEPDFPPARITDSQEDILRFRERFTLEQGVKELCRNCLVVQKKEERKKQGRTNLVPFIEAVVLAVLVFIAMEFLNTTWIGGSFDLFIVYSLVFGVTYGTAYGLLGALLGGIGELIFMSQQSSFVGVLTDYSFFIAFLMLILVGVIGGYMRDKFRRQNNNLCDQRDYLTSEVTEISRINDNNTYIKNVYEKRLISYENSLSKIYELTERLDFMEPQKVLFQAVYVVRDLLGMNDIAIYTASRRSKYFRLAASSTQMARSAGKSVKMDEENPLYKPLTAHEIFRNRDMSSGLPTFAGGIYDNDELMFIVMAWTDDIRKANLYSSDMLALICRLIQRTMARANMYADILRDENYISGTNVMNEAPFTGLLNVYLDGGRQQLLSYVALKLDLPVERAAEACRFVRDTDVVGIYKGAVCAILSNSELADSAFVIKRYENAGIHSEVAWEMMAEENEAKS